MTDDEMEARLRAAGAAWRNTAPIMPTATLDEPLAPPAAPHRRHHTAWLASAAVVVTALVAGGAFLLGRTSTSGDHHRPAAESAALEGQTWQLLGYGNDRLRNTSLATLVINEDGTLVADDTCSLVTGRAAADGDRLRVSRIQTRSYNCTDAVGEVTFDRGLATLRNDPTWTIDGDRLTISGDGPTLHLTAAPDVPAPTADRPTYTGATWRLEKVVDAVGTDHAVRGLADLRIDGDQLRASDTCNTMSGRATIDGNQLKADGFAITEIGCPDAADTPQVVDGILAGGARFELNGPTLTVTKAGKGTLTYSWLPDDQQATDPKRLTITAWRLRSVAGESSAVDIVLHVMADGTLLVKTGCGTVTGIAKVVAGTLTVGNVSTNLATDCPAQFGTLRSFLANGPVLWRIAGKQLVVNQSGAQAFALVFDPLASVPAATVELPGTWKLTQVEEDNGNSASGSGSSDTGITLTVAPHTYKLLTRCSLRQGDATVSDRTIDFSGPLVGPCHQDFVAQVDQVIDGTVTWTIRDGQLRLTKGNVTLTFER